MYFNIRSSLISVTIAIILGVLGLSFSSNLFSIVCAILFSIVFYFYRTKKDLVNYYLLFLPLLFFPIFYNHFVAPTLLIPLSDTSKAVFIFSVISLLAGVRIGEKINFRKRNFIMKKWGIIAISLIGLIPFFNQLVFGLPQLIRGNFQEIRHLASLPIFSSLVYFKYLGLIYLIKEKKWRSVFLYEIILLISVLSEFGKMPLMSFMLINIISFFYFGIINKDNIIKFSVVVSLTLILFFMYFNYHTATRNDYNIVTNLYDRGLIHYEFPKSFSMPYLYAQSPLTNLEVNVGSIMAESNFSNGYWLLNPIISMFRLANVGVADGYNFEVISFLNTINFSFYPFKDFGYLGVLVINTFLGIIIVSLYKKRDNSLLYLLTYIVWMIAGVELFFSNHFFTQTYPMIFFIFTFLYHLVMRKTD